MSRQEQCESVTRHLHGLGISHPASVLVDLPPPRLYEEAVRRGEGRLGQGGVLVVDTGIYTGRSAQDKFIVDEPGSRGHVAWGEVNRPFGEEAYQRLRHRLLAHLQGRDLFVQNRQVGADPRYRRKVCVVTTLAWQSLMMHTMLMPQQEGVDGAAEEAFTVIGDPSFKASPQVDGTHSEAFILLHLGRREMLIGGTAYGGELKKAVFTMMNYLLPLQGVFPMHCSANIGEAGDTAIFFGLSGTGKTTLSTDHRRKMVGDDEHGWSKQGVFNIEGGCYAKVVGLSRQAEPEIWACTRRFGTLLENVILDPDSRQVNLDDASRTENTRAAYPLHMLDNIQESGMGHHPVHVIMLTADAFGVLPPVARLTHEQAMYHFLSGYTARLAGTERGVSDPKAVFSTCFGEPFMVHDPVVYADLLGQRLASTGARCWLVNTGWTGGGFGTGFRMPIQETRTIIDHILANQLNQAPTVVDPIFGLHVPVAIEGVTAAHLTPRATWGDPLSYDERARSLAGQFCKNFRRFEKRVSAGIVACQPKGG